MKHRIYISDPNHNKSFIGRWLWIYRSKGWLQLSDDGLTITNGTLNLLIEYSEIKDLSLGTFARTAKPIPLNYINIKYLNGSEVNYVYILPFIPNKSPWLTSVWAMNKNTKLFIESLKQAANQ